jgi:hypothetical protein
MMLQCDEGRPHCGNCLKYRAECPGYSKEIKFVVGKPNRSSLHRKTENDFNPFHAFVDGGNGSISPKSLEKWESTIQLQSRILSSATIPERLHSSDLYLAQGLSFLIEHLKPSIQSAASLMTITR